MPKLYYQLLKKKSLIPTKRVLESEACKSIISRNHEYHQKLIMGTVNSITHLQKRTPSPMWGVWRFEVFPI